MDADQEEVTSEITRSLRRILSTQPKLWVALRLYVDGNIKVLGVSESANMARRACHFDWTGCPQYGDTGLVWECDKEDGKMVFRASPRDAHYEVRQTTGYEQEG